MKTMLELLQEHLTITTKVERKAMWDEILSMKLQGPSLDEFLIIDSHQDLLVKDYFKIKNNIKVTLSFSESLFF